MNIDPDRPPVVHDPHGREVEYRVVYESEVMGSDSPLLIELGDLPNPVQRYRIRIEVEQLPLREIKVDL